MMSKCEQRDEDEGEHEHLVIIIKGPDTFFYGFCGKSPCQRTVERVHSNV